MKKCDYQNVILKAGTAYNIAVEAPMHSCPWKIEPYVKRGQYLVKLVKKTITKNALNNVEELKKWEMIAVRIGHAE
jgi:hypothetical protein